MKLLRLCMPMACILVPSVLAEAGTLLSEDFETDGNGTRYTTSTTEFSDGGGDYFGRFSSGSTSASFTGETGSWFGAQDIDAATADGGQGSQSQRQTLTFSNIPIAGFTDLVLSMDVAEDDDGSSEDWDAPDLVHASFVLDGNAPTDFSTGYAIWFDNDGSSSNSAPYLNFDFDADGNDSLEDTEVTDTFTTYSRALGFDGNLLAGGAAVADLVITFDLNSGDEDIAIDNIVLEGNLIPEPTSLVVFLMASCGVGAVALRSKLG